MKLEEEVKHFFGDRKIKGGPWLKLTADTAPAVAGSWA